MPSKIAMAAAERFSDSLPENVQLGLRRVRLLAEAFDAFARTLMVEAYIEGVETRIPSNRGDDKLTEEWVAAELTGMAAERPQDAQKG